MSLSKLKRKPASSIPPWSLFKSSTWVPTPTSLNDGTSKYKPKKPFPPLLLVRVFYSETEKKLEHTSRFLYYRWSCLVMPSLLCELWNYLKPWAKINLCLWSCFCHAWCMGRDAKVTNTGSRAWKLAGLVNYASWQQGDSWLPSGQSWEPAGGVLLNILVQCVG